MANGRDGNALSNSIFKELIARLRTAPYSSSYDAGILFDQQQLRCVADEMCAEAGVNVRFHTFFVDCIATRDPIRVQSIRCASKAGLEELAAEYFIDCTGDADLAAAARCAFTVGRPSDNLAQPMTLNFRMANVSIQSIPDREEINWRFVQAKQHGDINCPRENILFFPTLFPGVLHFNTTRVLGELGTDPDSLSRAEMEGRRQVTQIAEWLRRNIPGFEDAYVSEIATQIGVRETRHIVGEYLLTAEDILQARKFPDCAARGCYPMDIHSPTGEGTQILGPPPNDWYEIPLRCLKPVNSANILVAGRPISATHEAHAAIRIMAIACSLGQAAGEYAASLVTSDRN
jgi:hypothetical protein